MDGALGSQVGHPSRAVSRGAWHIATGFVLVREVRYRMAHLIAANEDLRVGCLPLRAGSVVFRRWELSQHPVGHQLVVGAVMAGAKLRARRPLLVPARGRVLGRHCLGLTHGQHVPRLCLLSPGRVEGLHHHVQRLLLVLLGFLIEILPELRAAQGWLYRLGIAIAVAAQIGGRLSLAIGASHWLDAWHPAQQIAVSLMLQEQLVEIELASGTARGQ